MNLEELYSRIPATSKSKLEQELDNMSEEDRNWFLSKIGQYSSFKELQENYQQEISDPRSQKIFLFDVKGVGAGEIWCAWLLKDAKISGGSETFDITQGDLKYEVKAYNFGKHWKTKAWQLKKYTGPWRLGNAGAMTNFSFVENLLYNAELAHRVKDTTLDHPDIKRMKKLIQNIEDHSKGHGMVGDFARGEVSQKKMRWMIEFIDTANSYVNRIHTEYDIVTFGSTTPGNPDIAYVIKESSPEEIATCSFEIIRPVDMYDFNDQVAFDRTLIKSKYIREGIESMIDDINNDLLKVEQKYSGVQFVVFRKDQINITKRLQKIKDRSKFGLLAVVGDVFNLSSASIRVKEEIIKKEI